jgi:hypothetical protein
MEEPIDLQIEKEAYLMNKKYGKEKAIQEAKNIAESYIKDIEALPYFDVEKIDKWRFKKMFWLSVASKIENLNNNN